MVDLRWIQDRLSRGGSLNGLNLQEEEMLRAHARASGLRVEQLIAAWRCERSTKPITEVIGFNRPARADWDLDFWADDDQPTDDDDGDGEEACAACHGSGRDAAGGVCRACGGSGRIPVPADDDEEENDEREDED